MKYPTVRVPYLNAAQMAEVDRAMIEDYQIDLPRMMENAGRNLALLARDKFLSGNPQDKGVAVLAGSGGNGGGAMVCARHLHNWGVKVYLFATRPISEMKEVPRQQLSILQKMGVPVVFDSPERPGGHFNLIIDGLLGYTLTSAPRDVVAEMIRWANSRGISKLSLDIPSGLNPSSGKGISPVVKATATLALALPKTGLRASSAREFVGKLYLADISVPPELYGQPPLSFRVPPIFTQSEIVEV
jgi:NAD(P)H-hydrate epimerase